MLTYLRSLWNNFEISKNKQNITLLFLWIFFCIYQNILKFLPEFLMSDTVEQLKISTYNISNFGSWYFYGYALMHLPFTFLIHKFHIKRVFIYSIVISVVSLLLFVFDTNILFLKILRFIQGALAACGFLGVLKFAIEFCKGDYRDSLLGAFLSIGSIGAIISLLSLTAYIHTLGYIGIIVLLFACPVIAIILISKINFQDYNPEAFTINDFVSDAVKIINNKRLIEYAVVSLGLYIPMYTFGDVWAMNFLISKYGVSYEDASTKLCTLYLGFISGAIVLPGLLQKYSVIVLRYVLAVLILIFAMLLFCGDVNMITSLLFLIGFFAGSVMLCFCDTLFHEDAKKVSIIASMFNIFATLNSGIMLQIMGAIFCIGKGEDSALLNLPSYTDIQAAFLLTLLIIGMCFLMSLSMKKNDG